MKKFIRDELYDYRILLRNIPSLIVSLFILSVVLMNLLANKEFVSYRYFALDCGFLLSWVSFLCMDMICKRFGPKASAKISILAMIVNILVCLLFKVVSMTPGKWGEFYSTGSLDVNAALNSTIGGCWYVVLGSSIAMLLASITNSTINQAVANRLTTDGFKAFALRSYISTIAGQLVDNLAFSLIVSYTFFGWSMIQVIICSVTGAIAELLCEILLSPLGYRITEQWEDEDVGIQYIEYRKKYKERQER